MRKHLRLNPRSSSHNLTISAGHTSLCLAFGIVRLVHLGRAFHNFWWVHPQLNIFHCDSLRSLSDLSIAYYSLDTGVPMSENRRGRIYVQWTPPKPTKAHKDAKSPSTRLSHRYRLTAAFFFKVVWTYL
jgi:hypothetical protein